MGGCVNTQLMNFYANVSCEWTPTHLFLIAGPPGVSLSICEAFVYTDQALPIERCPAFRDQPPGSTATYNGKCYIFYNQQPTDFEVRMKRGPNEWRSP